VKSFTTWGVTDRYSWREKGRDGHPLLLDEKLQPKPAYHRCLELLQANTNAAQNPAPARPAIQGQTP
jgi:GH35 family endo-1,4-beta-xylanase